MDVLRLRKPTTIDAEVRPPGSKSLTNRALALAAIARGRTRIEGALAADDSRLMVACLRTLGIAVDVSHNGTEIEIEGAGGAIVAAGEPSLDAGTAGTVARFLAAILAASPGRARIDGSPRMRERPMAMLIDALRSQGARIQCLGSEGFLPIAIGPHDGSLRGGSIHLARPASSQFVSGLVFAALLAERATNIVLEQGTPARPYVSMTLAVVKAFGGEARWTNDGDVEVHPARLSACRYAIEPDASGASYFLALAAIHGGRVTIPGLGCTSLQGDARFAELLARMGAHVIQTDDRTTVAGTGRLVGGSFDLSDMPDMTPTLAVTAAHARGSTAITGVGVLRHHESDRLAAIANELRKLGADVREHLDGLEIDPPDDGPRAGVELDTYADHRMAMALSLVGDVAIRDPGCVAKTFPRYFDELAQLGMVVTR